MVKNPFDQQVYKVDGFSWNEKIVLVDSLEANLRFNIALLSAKPSVQMANALRDKIERIEALIQRFRDS